MLTPLRDVLRFSKLHCTCGVVLIARTLFYSSCAVATANTSGLWGGHGIKVTTAVLQYAINRTWSFKWYFVGLKVTAGSVRQIMLSAAPMVCGAHARHAA